MLKTIVATFQTVMGSSMSQQSAAETISLWRTRPEHELIFDSGRREISHYLEAVDRLLQSPTKLNNELISAAMARLRREFVTVLSRQVDYHAGPISTITTAEWSSIADSTAYAFRYEDYVVSEPPSNDVVSYLRNIAVRMNSNGKIGECVKAYKSVRQSFLRNQLKRLRFEELSMGYNTKRYVWDELKLKMELWIQVSKICVKILFEREKKLCDTIFRGIGDGDAIKDDCFVGTVQDFAVGLFGFADQAMSLSNLTYDKMETVFGVYDAFLWVLPHANALFSSEPGKQIRDRCAETLSRIENEVGRMMYDFENAVLHEISGFLSADERGGVHQSTEYVMQQINLIVRNKNLLTNLIKSTPSLTFGDSIIPQEAFGDSYNVTTRSCLELHLILIIIVLQQNLRKKANGYPDPSLGHLFMMNNIRHILQKIQGSNELREMIGDSYLSKLKEKFMSAMINYEETTCNKFLICFEDDGLYITRCFCKSQPSKTAVRRRLKAFDGVFEEIQRLHSSWTIPDLELRDNIRVSMSERLVPAYRNFLEKFVNNPEIQLLLDRNIKYSAEDLEVLVLEKLFAQN